MNCVERLKVPKKAKIILFDIETSPLISYTWGLYDQNVIALQEDWKLLSFAFKELGKKKVTCFTRLNFKDITDRALTKKLWELMDSADIIIAHNGDKFDVKKSNAKFLEHELMPPSPAQQIDTLKIARSRFALTSNKLDDLAKLLKVGSKLKTPGFPMWLGCMAGNKASFDIMAKYNKHDVLILEKVYLKLRQWAKNHPNIGQIEGLIDACPTCKSTALTSNGIRYTKVQSYRRYVCKNCGASSKGALEKKAIKPTRTGL